MQRIRRINDSSGSLRYFQGGVSPLLVMEITPRDVDDGIQVDQLNDLERVIAETANSIYEITVIRASTGDVLVRGGKLFPERTRAQIIGASWGGPGVKLSGIYTGMNV